MIKQLFVCCLVMLSLSMRAMGTNPVIGLLERIDKGASEKFSIELVDTARQDFFEVYDKGRKIAVKGNSYVSIATGIHWYLKYVANIHLSWNCMQVKLPVVLPPVKKAIRQATPYSLRYYLNYCTFSYSMAFWDWERWQQEIDWMALHGINVCLQIVGTDAVWRNTLLRLGYDKDEVNGFVAGTGFQAWWLMNNLEGWGGPLTDNWYRHSERLGRAIVKRMREWGIIPILPGYSGMVPHNAKDKLDVHVQNPGLWCSYHRPAFLQPTDKKFGEIAKVYYQEQAKILGKSVYYSMDPFHEGGSVAGIDVKTVGQAIWQSMRQANPHAKWIIQAWGVNPKWEMIENIPKGDIVVLDLNAENVPQWGDEESDYYRPNGFGHHDWLYCMLLNFGGNVGLFGRMDATIRGFYKAKASRFGDTMKGVGLTMEGIENNPMMYELLCELPWRDNVFDKEHWIKQYCIARYGKENADVLRAWQMLIRSIYNHPKRSKQQGTTESIFCARPGKDVYQVSTWSEMMTYYNPDTIIDAARLFLNAAHEFRNEKYNDNYEYDLVDIVRQAISEKGRKEYQKMKQALDYKDVNAFERYSDNFLHLLLMQDTLLSTRKEFMLDTWLMRARSLGITEEEKKQYEWNARTQITVWGNRIAAEQGGLHDYAHKEWAGILRTLYYHRWWLWISEMKKQLRGANVQILDFYSIEEAWTRQCFQTPSTIYKDVVDIAERALNR